MWSKQPSECVSSISEKAIYHLNQCHQPEASPPPLLPKRGPTVDPNEILISLLTNTGISSVMQLKIIDFLLLLFSATLLLLSHQWSKQKEVRGQQALKVLIIHTAAGRQRPKGAGCHYQPTTCLCVCVLWNCAVFDFWEISFILQKLTLPCAQTHNHPHLSLHVCLKSWQLLQLQPSVEDCLLSLNNEIKPLQHGQKQNILGSERQTRVQKKEEKERSMK